MQNRRPLLSYILINIAISALTTLVVLLIWSHVTAIPEAESKTSPAATQSATQASEESAAVVDYSDQLQITTIIAPGDIENEHVVIEHVGSQDVPLAGWTLKDEDGHRFTFPDLVLHPGGSLEVFTRQGEGSVTRLYWNEEEAIWDDAETASLMDPSNDQRAAYTLP